MQTYLSFFLTVIRGGMAHIYRLVFFTFSLLIPFASHALIPVAPTGLVNWSNNYYNDTVYRASPAAACQPMGFPTAGNMTGTLGTSSERWICMNSNGSASAYYLYSPVRQFACPANSTVSGSSCACTSPYVEDSTHTSCMALPVRATSPNGELAPLNPLGQAPVAIAAAIAFGLLAAGAAVLALPVITVSMLGSGALMAALIASPLFQSSGTAQQAMSDGTQPLSVQLTPTTLPSTAQPTVGAASVKVSATGQLIPGGGGTYTGNGASGGWAPATGGATGEWQYTPPVSAANPAPVPVATITKNGFRYSSVTPQISSIFDVYTDGSSTVTKAMNVPVNTPSGTPTTAKISSTTSYDSTGAVNPGSPALAIGTKLGNGSDAGNGSALTPGIGTGTGVGAGSGSSGGTCGGAGQAPCNVKIDETGTPTTGKPDGTGLQDGFQSLDDAMTAAKDKTGKDTSWGVTPTWVVFTGACHPVVLMTLPASLGSRQITLDLCPWMPTIYLLMNLLWTVWTFGAIVNMVFRVTTTPGA